MAIVAGADGCGGGWICVTLDTETGVLASGLYGNAGALVHQVPTPAILMVDIPIGLTQEQGRVCDEQARGLLGPRHVCVFPAPIRPALHAPNREEAARINRDADGRGVGAQAWAIYPKIREMDEAVGGEGGNLQNRVFEVHPEVSFREWNGQTPIPHGKRTARGKAQRQGLLAGFFGDNAFRNVRGRYIVGQVGDDDITDAFAALWTARRRLAGAALCIPAEPPVDGRGLRMEMWY